jgi:hypothetical protein
MPYSRRVEERRKEREEKRRQTELTRRQEEDLLKQKQAESREQALQEARQRDAAWEAARAQREARLQSMRFQKRNERRDTERETRLRMEHLDELRNTKRQELSLLQEKLAQQLALRKQLTEARQAERQEAEKAEEKRQASIEASLEATRQERAEVEHAAGQAVDQRLSSQRARLEESKKAALEAERAATERQVAQKAIRQSRLEERLAQNRGLEKHQAALEEARKSKRDEQQDAAREADNAAAKRQAALETARQERLEEEATKRRGTERRQAALKEAHQERSAARQATVRAAENAASQRQAAQEAARQERLEERNQLTREADRHQAALKDIRQARLTEQRQAEKIAASQISARSDSRKRRQAERRRTEKADNPSATQRLFASQSRPNPQNSSDQIGGNRSNRVSSSAEPPEPRDPFQDPIPSGRLSGSLPWLRVTGNQITNIFGDPILLRGVALLGMDSSEPHSQLGFAAGAGINQLVIDSALSWGANVLRVAINRNRVLHGYGDWSAWDYLSDLDDIIHQAAAGGAYTLLTLSRLDDVTIFGTLPGPGGERLPNYIAPMPDYDSIGMWRVLGERYASEPAVLFDLYTAPHPPLEDDLSGFTSDWDLWTLWIQVIAADLRRLHPRALIFASGLDDGSDLSGFPILGTAGQPIPNLIYTVHLYPRRADPLTTMQTLARAHPLFISEWGGSRTDLLWGERTELALRSKGLGWTAAFWNSEPALTQSVYNQITPTPFGALVRRALAMAGESPVTIKPLALPGLSNLTIG